MLGKGLESLIPPAKGGQAQDGQPGPAILHTQPEPAMPPEALPVAPDEPLLPPGDVFTAIEAAPAEPLLEAGVAQPVVPVQPVLPVQPAVAEPHSKPTAKHNRSEAVFYLETDKIKPNQQQPRRHFDEEALADLAASIREFGIIQPLVVTKIEREVPTGTEVEYELIAGERRLMAAKKAGLERVPAIVRMVDMNHERLELAVIENLQRENLSPIEMARAFARLQDEFRLTQREIASRLGKSREVIANTLRLLDLPGYIQEALEKGQISESHGRLLLSIDDTAAQQALFHDLLNQHLTTRELRRRTLFLRKKEPPAPEAGENSPEIKQFEERLKSELGAPVKIRSEGGAGKITFEFYSAEELAHIMERLGTDEV